MHRRFYQKLLILIFFAYSSPVAVAAAEEVAIVLFVVGEAIGLQDGKKIPLKKSQVLKTQDEIETKDGKVDVQIGASAVIRVVPFTKIKLIELFSDNKANKSRIQLVSGKIFARVDKGTKKEDFSVVSPTYSAGVRGTQFAIGDENNGKRSENPEHEDSDIPNGVFVKEGEVGVTTDNGDNVPVKANEEVVLSPEGLLKQPLEEFMLQKMKILDGFKKISEENYKMLKDQKLKNEELLNKAKQDL
ncbi:iron dicitrate transport regulator FecR [Leptospira wolffii]|uniref:FecR family protein n=1 Tax=Leptospira wolffii TaxID=409998 RepID=UPI00034AD33B|nr:FecR family protein [Leptospira wolffii]TGK59358.1 iron dicitrate transport regulator FecR [Leptospira wolffii]TGK71259.1 iron dicitrate transport regulator FecR [Leptospira wolffii]TGK77826.1 iron dicitrate transport regulator FecR [Leptospira wolffii]TGL29463.1 iron dicitrate transport regulator FecR [Leptospira wolffii]